MPLYEKKCPACGKIYTIFSSVKDRHNAHLCEKDGFVLKMMVSLPSIVTDKSFFYTGKVDNRLGGPPVSGRKDFWNRAKGKGLVPIEKTDGFVTSTSTEERIKKANLQVM